MLNLTEHFCNMSFPKALDFHIHELTGSDSKCLISNVSYAGKKNAVDQVWCDKKNIYVSGKESDTCPNCEYK